MGFIIEDLCKDPIVVDSPNHVLTEFEEVPQKQTSIEIPTTREVSLSDFDFRHQGFYSNEIWDKSFNLNARITRVIKDKITCECVIDKEKKIFETRTFPSLLFEHLKNIQIHHPVIVSIKTKPGSTRIDIRDGKNIVDLSLFDLKDGWKQLMNSGLDKPLSFDK